MLDLVLAAAGQLAAVVLCAGLARGALRATLLICLTVGEGLGPGGAA